MMSPAKKIIRSATFEQVAKEEAHDEEGIGEADLASRRPGIIG